MRVNRFVLDANIWVSHLITGSEQKLIDTIVDNDLIVFRCDELLAEIARVLIYPRLKKYNVGEGQPRKEIQEIKNFNQRGIRGTFPVTPYSDRKPKAAQRLIHSAKPSPDS
jgi:predicted nucleic acid-binding protein